MEGSAVPALVHCDTRRSARRSVRAARRRGRRHVKGTWPAAVFFALAALGPLVGRDPFLLDSLILILLWGAAASAWNVAGGYAGQVSLGHAAFFGLGAYSAALLGTRWGLSPWIGLAIGATFATAVGFVIGFLSNRLRGPYFVLATIAFSQVLLVVASRWRGFTAGSEGIPVPFRPGFWTLGITDKRVWVYLVLVLAVLLYLVQFHLERSRLGYRLAAVREDEDAALSLGVPARRLKVGAITASAALTAICGALWSQYVGFVDPFYVFSIDLSVRFALAAVLGGIGTPFGPFLGAALITTLETYLRARFAGIGAGLVGIYLIIYGVALIVMMRFAPQGLLPWLGERRRRPPLLGMTP
ncbi:MAG: branched-chain amino acid ABC transporter permease [Candidatus Rokuibacteriota bacterium]|nr:MAG: branched-chain amino acid ABC transporter permease [Candidatus Rokubacteria bacterium]